MAAPPGRGVRGPVPTALLHGHVMDAFTSAVRMVFSVALTLGTFILVVLVQQARAEPFHFVQHRPSVLLPCGPQFQNVWVKI